MTKCTVFARITPKTGCLKMKRNFRLTFSCEKDNSISITASLLETRRPQTAPNSGGSFLKIVHKDSGREV